MAAYAISEQQSSQPVSKESPLILPRQMILSLTALDQVKRNSCMMTLLERAFNFYASVRPTFHSYVCTELICTIFVSESKKNCMRAQFNTCLQPFIFLLPKNNLSTQKRQRQPFKLFVKSGFRIESRKEIYYTSL